MGGRGHGEPRCFGEGSLLNPGRVGGCCHEAWGRWLVKDEQGPKGRTRGGTSPLPPAGEWASQSEAGCWYLREAGREEAEGLTLIGGQWRSVAIEVSRDAAAGGT